MSELKPCPCCIDYKEQDLSMPTSEDGIEYVVCQLCGLRVDAESWNEIPRLPEGYKLVPIEPTKQMLLAGNAVLPSIVNCDNTYKAMLEAADEEN